MLVECFSFKLWVIKFSFRVSENFRMVIVRVVSFM